MSRRHFTFRALSLMRDLKHDKILLNNKQNEMPKRTPMRPPEKTDPDPITKSLRYNTGKIDWTIIEYQALKPMVMVLMYGEHKYSTFKHKTTGEVKKGSEITREEAAANYETATSGRDNWKLGFSVKELRKSKMRHTVAMLSGEENDSESGLPHIGHIMCNDLFISYYTQTEEGKARAL